MISFNRCFGAINKFEAYVMSGAYVLPEFGFARPCSIGGVWEAKRSTLVVHRRRAEHRLLEALYSEKA